MDCSCKYIHTEGGLFYHVNLIKIGKHVAAGESSDDLDILIGKWSELATKDCCGEHCDVVAMLRLSLLHLLPLQLHPAQ